MFAGPNPGGGLRVLIVDNDSDHLEVCAELLGRRCRVTTAGSPGEALEKLRCGHFDVVLSDQRMPEMSGTELLAEVRRLHPRTRRIVMSASAESAEILPALDGGDIHRFVEKPVREEDLLNWGAGEAAESAPSNVIGEPEISLRHTVHRALESGRGLREILADLERTMLIETLERYGGNQVAAARKLKLPRQTLQNRLKKYGL